MNNDYYLIDARLRCYLFIYLFIYFIIFFIAVILDCAVSSGEVFGRKGVGNEVGTLGVRALGEIGKLQKFRKDQIRAASKIFGSRLRTS